MDKLELKHLSPYLPFKVSIIPFEWKVNEYWKGKKVMLTGFQVDDDRAIFKHRDLISESNIFGIVTFKIEECQPILRPLSDLTNEIEINGKKFIPIYGLAMIEGSFDMSAKLDFAQDNDTWIIGFKNHLETKVFGYDTINGFGVHFRPEMQWEQVCNQLELHQKLFEWHFDVFGLIEKGLAIDINTIQ